MSVSAVSITGPDTRSRYHIKIKVGRFTFSAQGKTLSEARTKIYWRIIHREDNLRELSRKLGESVTQFRKYCEEPANAKLVRE